MKLVYLFVLLSFFLATPVLFGDSAIRIDSGGQVSYGYKWNSEGDEIKGNKPSPVFTDGHNLWKGASPLKFLLS